ncbi:MAG TPA: glucosamine 6-phosphate synthetase [bacterium]|nr:glucosamine 6-phosphate synthetase [bacterium]
MCGLTGVIFGKKRRKPEELDHLTWLFTRLLVLSEERGPHATGAAWLDQGGEHRLFKLPVTAEQFIMDKAYHDLLSGVSNSTTLLLGHNRWRTRGDERNNLNNHPIRAGNVIGAHNGTILNADYLFTRFKVRRHAEVDSEIIFRLADRAFRNGQLDLDKFKRWVAHCRGQLTTIMASRKLPGTVLVLKGNKPLELRYSKRHRAVIYASDPAFLDAALAGERGWVEIPLPPMSLVVFRHDDLSGYSREVFTFQAQARRVPEPAGAGQ